CCRGIQLEVAKVRDRPRACRAMAMRAVRMKVAQASFLKASPNVFRSRKRGERFRCFFRGGRPEETDVRPHTQLVVDNAIRIFEGAIELRCLKPENSSCSLVVTPGALGAGGVAMRMEAGSRCPVFRRALRLGTWQ